jgi:hypothetical protein
MLQSTRLLSPFINLKLFTSLRLSSTTWLKKITSTRNMARINNQDDDGDSNSSSNNPCDGVVRGNVRVLQKLFQKRHHVADPFKVGVSFLAKETLREIHLTDSFIVSIDNEPLAMSLVPLSHSEGFHSSFDAYIMVYHSGSEEVINKLVSLGKLVVVIRMDQDLPICKPLPEMIAQRENCHVTSGSEDEFDSGMLCLSRRLRDRRRWGSQSSAHAVCH